MTTKIQHIMSVINIFIGTVTGSTDALVKVSDTYKEITQEVYDLSIPTTASDSKNLKQDRDEVAFDLKKALKKMTFHGKTTEKTTNS